MALLRAAARVVPRPLAVVATFDHGTGPTATEAAALVTREAARLRFPAVVGHASSAGRTEAEWRAARRAFLSDVARRSGAIVVTAHTRDDQLETILMRVMRDAGPRGLAGLYADGDAIRPLLSFTRDEVGAYTDALEVPWVHDPTNDSVAFLRNRVRRDLLPALTRADPWLPVALDQIAERAASWRRQVDGWAARAGNVSGQRVRVPAARLAGRDRDQLAILWPALAARVGLAMDWRGTERAAAFTTHSRVGARMPLAGGWEISRTRQGFELARAMAEPASPIQPLRSGTRWLGWRFTMEANAASDEWVALLPANARLSVRRWQPGDRMRLSPGVARKVKRFLSDAHVSGARRGHWPVVLAGDEIVWIPGVRRSDAAAVRPGRPGVLYRCVPDYL